MERLTRFDELADKDGIISVYPAALHGRWNVGVHAKSETLMMHPGRRRRFTAGAAIRVAEGGYPGGGGGGGGIRAAEVIREAEQPSSARIAQSSRNGRHQFLQPDARPDGPKYSVDSSRIYAIGLSEGGFMSMRMGCALSDRFAAVAAVGAAMPKTMICLPAASRGGGDDRWHFRSGCSIRWRNGDTTSA